MTPDLIRLDGQVALVTGGGTPLAHAAATALAEAGADTALLYTTGIDETRKAIAALRRRCMGLQLDLSRATVPQLQGAIQQVGIQLGRLDILVNCAATADAVPALDCTEEEWDHALRVNLRASFFLCQAAATYFRKQGRGKIINVAPLQPAPPRRASIAYATCNNALVALTHLLANEWAPLGINVSCIILGPPGANAAMAIEPQATAPVEPVTAGRPGTADSLPGALVYLASTASDGIHGASLLVDSSPALA
ncbi:MAG: SDR family oxidoreductase [Anaerolineae bacterium]|nr:SDR family oxidoreductase [Anaerolineae bacterium]